MAIEIVDLPIKHCDFPWFFVCLRGRVCPLINGASQIQKMELSDRSWMVGVLWMELNS